LAIVTSTVTVTKDIFKEWPQSINDVPDYVNQALFNLVSSRCEAGPKAHIRACNGNGIKAITELHRHYAQITTEIIDSAMNRYQQLRQRNNETATSFIQRFDTIVDECRQLGEDFDSDKLLSRFMDALDTSSDTYKARIEALLAQKNMSQLNASLNPITLPYVQSQLLSIDEKRGLTALTSGFKCYKTGDPHAMRASHNYTRTPYKNTEQSQKKPVKCGYKYCGKLGHTTFECRK
jgi:Retrotransposon gag protein